MLFATTSNGVYLCDIAEGKVQRILGNKQNFGLSKAGILGYFGITRHAPTGCILVASRERNNPFKALSTYVKLYLIDPISLNATLLAVINDVHDVHQIAWHDDRVFLTDTGKNRLVIYNTSNGKRVAANIGDKRRDINHLNAVTIYEDHLYLGLNNRSIIPSSILKLPLTALCGSKDDKQFDILKAGELIVLKDAMYTHDIEADKSGRLFACKSREGIVFNIETQGLLLEIEGWVRGLAFSPTRLCVGVSIFGDRKERHSEKADGAILVYSLPDLKQLDSLLLSKAGQVNDLFYLEQA